MCCHPEIHPLLKGMDVEGLLCSQMLRMAKRYDRSKEYEDLLNLKVIDW